MAGPDAVAASRDATLVGFAVAPASGDVDWLAIWDASATTAAEPVGTAGGTEADGDAELAAAACVADPTAIGWIETYRPSQIIGFGAYFHGVK